MAYWTGFTYPYGNSNTIITNDISDTAQWIEDEQAVFVIPFRTSTTSIVNINNIGIPGTSNWSDTYVAMFITNTKPDTLSITVSRTISHSNVVLSDCFKTWDYSSKNYSFTATGGTTYYLCLSMSYNYGKTQAVLSSSDHYFTFQILNLINNFTITYNSNGGTAVNTPSEYNDSILPLTLPTPTKTGYTFNGWYTTSNTTPIKILPSGSTGNKAFIANWTPTNYSITYNLNNGTQASGAITAYNIETSTFNLPIPTRTNYAFVGWYDNSSFTGNRITQITKGSYGNKTYYAKWALIQTFYWTNTNYSSNGLAQYLHDLTTSNGIAINWYAPTAQVEDFINKINTYCGTSLTFNEKQLLSDYNALVNALNNSSTPDHLSGTTAPSLSTKSTDDYISSDDLIALENAFNNRKFI